MSEFINGKKRKIQRVALAAAQSAQPLMDARGSGLPLQLRDGRHRKTSIQLTGANQLGHTADRSRNRGSTIQKGGDYSGSGSDGPHKQGWLDFAKEKAHGAAIGAANYVRGHPGALASTAGEMATGTVDPLALLTALDELKAAISGVGADISHGDGLSIVGRCVDATAAALRAGASVASVSHAWNHAIGLPLPLAGDAVWYGAAAARNRIKAAIHPIIIKSVEHKNKIGKQD